MFGPAAAFAAAPSGGRDLAAVGRDLFVRVGSSALAAFRGASGPTFGADGRLTVLLLGSDQRFGLAGERIDTIIVASLDPGTHKVAMASIPRDTVKFPRAISNGGGTSGGSRVNGMFATYSGSKTAKAHAFEADVELALGIEIDSFVYVRFNGFNDLIDNVGGITVDTPGTIVDKRFQDEVTRPYGIWFPDDDAWWIGGSAAPQCVSWRPSADACTRALPYVRSRKGTEGDHNNNDYRRAARQQRVVMSAIHRVIERGNGSDLEALRVASQEPDGGPGVVLRIVTDLPRDTAMDALALYALLQDATIGKTVVFGPQKWAIHSSDLPTGLYKLKLGPVREWIDQKMPSVP